MNKYELIGIVFGIVIFTTILVATIWTDRTEPRPGRRG